MQTELTFYRNPTTPILGTTPSASWKYPGTALSASSVRVYSSSRTLKAAYWILVWNPSAGAGANACRLITADDGPTNEQQIAFLNKSNSNSPIVQSFNITAAMRGIVQSGSSKQVLMQTCGDSASKIYRSTIDLVWGD